MSIVSLYDYVTQTEGTGDALTEASLDLVFMFHDRGFVNLREWEWDDLDSNHITRFYICEYEIILASQNEGNVRVVIVRGETPLLDVRLVLDDLEKPYLRQLNVVPPKITDLDPLRILLKLHDPVD